MGSNEYLWVKTLHIVFVTSWFAGLFYLPRIFVNLAMVEDATTRERLLMMARKLLRFMTGLAVLALVFGVLAAGLRRRRRYRLDERKARARAGLLLVYHVWCATLYGRLVRGEATHSHVWFRWFNEAPVLMLLAIVILVVVKPF